MDAENYDYAPARIVQGAQSIIDLKNKKDPWEVIDQIIKVWEATNPKTYKSFITNLDEVKGTRKVTAIGGKQFKGVSKDKVTGGLLQYKLDIPVKVVYMIRRVYSADELPMDKKFYAKWARRYPDMVISEVV